MPHNCLYTQGSHILVPEFVLECILITVGRLGVLQSAPPVPALHQIKGLSSESMRSISANEGLPYNTAERVIHAHVNRLLRNGALSHQSVNPCRFQAAYSKPLGLAGSSPHLQCPGHGHAAVLQVHQRKFFIDPKAE